MKSSLKEYKENYNQNNTAVLDQINATIVQEQKKNEVFSKQKKKIDIINLTEEDLIAAKLDVHKNQLQDDPKFTNEMWSTIFIETDELGFAAQENPVHVHDFHATILHLLGLDHEKLTFRFMGRDFRLTDVHGQIIESILS